jgi:AcrR family transcriptional regulator
MSKKSRLTRERIVEAAIAVADRGGISAVSMRNVGSELGVEAMSLYHYVANKEGLLDTLSEHVFSQIVMPDEGTPWREALETRAFSARSVLSAHPWAVGMIESRPIPGPALLEHHDRVIGCLMGAGFEPVVASQAFAVVDAFIYGFVLSETTMPFDMREGAEMEYAAEIAPDAEKYPHLAANLAALQATGNFAFSNGFRVGIDLILDSLEAKLGEMG